MTIFPTTILLYFLGSLIEQIEHLEEIEVGRENNCERKACPSCGSEPEMLNDMKNGHKYSDS